MIKNREKLKDRIANIIKDDRPVGYWETTPEEVAERILQEVEKEEQ
jgi:hypothetical protein